MIKHFEKLTKEERELLLKAPVLVSLLASCSFNKINKSQKADAIKLAHIKTFAGDVPLIPYYDAVDKLFKEEYEDAQKKYAPFDDSKLNSLRKEIDKINAIISKLDKGYGKILHQSLENYGKHVKNAGHNVFQDFVFPLALPKFSQ